MASLAQQDPEIARAIQQEDKRQRDFIVLIASENYASSAVLEAQAGVMSNKYAEGYPGKRYYAGCENVDIVESVALDRAKQLFGADHANPMQDPRTGTGVEGASASLISNKVYVSHGYRGFDTLLLSIYDCATNMWTHGGPTAPDAAVARSEMGGRSLFLCEPEQRQRWHCQTNWA